MWSENNYVYMSMLAAVRANNVERVKLLRSRGKGWTDKHQRELWRTAVELGHLEMLECLHSLHCKRELNSCEWAIEHGHGRRLVEWLRGIGQRYTGCEVIKAVEQGDLALLEWLCEDSVHFLWHAPRTYLAAVEVGRLDIVRYLEGNGCLERAIQIRSLLWRSDEEKGRCQMRNDALLCAAGNGHLDLLLHLREQPLLQCPLRASDKWRVMAAAVQYGQLEVVAFLHEEGFPWGGERPYPGMLLLDADKRHVPSMSQSKRMRWYECARYVLAYGCQDSTPDELEDRARLLRDIVRHCLLPKWRSTVAWMVKVRPYAWHWLEEHAKIQCAEGGAGRKSDLEAFEEDCAPVIDEAMLELPFGAVEEPAIEASRVRIAASTFAPGKGLFATVSAGVGEVVLEEAPFLIVPYNGRMGVGVELEVEERARLVAWMHERGLAMHPWTKAASKGEPLSPGLMSDAEHEATRLLMLKGVLEWHGVHSKAKLAALVAPACASSPVPAAATTSLVGSGRAS